ncbi:O-antigen ligase family protein [Tsuneonella sp. HG249]
MVAITYASFFAAPHSEAAQIFLVIFLCHGLFALALDDRLGVYPSKYNTILLLSLGWGALLYCILTYLLLLLVREAGDFDWLHLGIGVSNVRQLAFYGLTSAAIGAGLGTLPATLQRRKKVRNFAFVAAGSGMCIWSGGRAAVGALVLSFCFAIFMAKPTERARVARGILSALLAGIAVSLIWLPHEAYGLPRLLNAAQSAKDGFNGFASNRIVMWQETLAAFADRPLLGYGMGQFKFIVPSAVRTFTHPHNSVLQFLFQWGLVGTAAVLIMWRPAFKAFGSVLRDRENVAGNVAATLLVAHFAMSLLEGNLFHTYPISIVIMALVILRNSISSPLSVPDRHREAAG